MRKAIEPRMKTHEHGCGELCEAASERDTGTVRQIAKSSSRTELTVRGMNCGNCAQHVTQALQSVPSVASATVNLEQGRASVRWKKPEKADLPPILQAAAGAGYEASVLDTETEEARDQGHDHDHSDRQAGWQMNLW